MDADLINSTLTPFGHFVREMRIARGVYLKNMADFIGISSAHLSGVEFGRNELTKEILQKTFEFFSAAQEAEAVPVYQVAIESGVGWLDVKKELYDKCDDRFKRVIYLHQPALDAETRKLVLELCRLIIDKAGHDSMITRAMAQKAEKISERLEAGE